MTELATIALELGRTVPALCETLVVAAAVERDRRTLGPLAAVAAARGRGAARRGRTGSDLTRLLRAVRWVDRVLGANCYRRTLLVASLDSGLAGREVLLGLNAKAGGVDGHAWAEGPAAGETLVGDYEAVFRV